MGTGNENVLRLGEEVGEQDLVVLAIGDGIEGLDGCEEVASKCQPGSNMVRSRCARYLVGVPTKE
jgi:hypothetical protein